jgi:hypothetical protein
MFHPALQLEIARQLHQDRLARTASHRNARRLPARFRRVLRSRAEPAPHQELEQPFLIRHSRAGDEAALERLAQLDSRPLPEGSFLVAEVKGEIVAAATLDVDAEPLGDPFRPTANLRQLLSLQARYERRSRQLARHTSGAVGRALEDLA